jgi:hypothetical protein
MAATALNISDIQLFTILKGKLGEKEAESLVSYVKVEAKKQVDEKIEYINNDIEKMKNEIIGSMATKDGLTAAIAESKTEMIKWMFIFVFTSTITTIGSILAIIKFFIKA